jgi:hypothetical protein
MEPDVTALSMSKGAAVDSKISTAGLGVRDFALTADSKHIAVVDVDGSVCVHSLSYSTEMGGASHISQKTMETFNTNIVAKTVTRASGEMGCKVSWYPMPAEKLLLAVPSTKGSVVLLTPSSAANASGESRWGEAFLIGNETASHGSHDINLAVFSPNGRYLATADVTGTVVIWAFDTTRPAQSAPIHTLTAIRSPLQDLVWGRNAADNYLIATTVNEWYEFPDVVAGNARPALMPGSAEQSTVTDAGAKAADFLAGFTNANTSASADADEDALIAAAMAAEEQYLTQAASPVATAKKTTASPAVVASPAAARTAPSAPARSPAPKKRLTKVNAAAIKDDDDDLFDDEEVASAPAANKGASTTAGAADEGVASAADVTSIAAIKHKSGVNIANKRLIDDEALDMDDDDADLDDEDNALDHGDDVTTQEPQLSLAELMKLAKGGSGVAAMAPARKLQAPFQPSSTKFDEKRRRYLVWNKVGSIVLREETVENRIEIRFNNTGGSNRNESFPDRAGFTMGALSYEGAVFATEPEPVDEPKGANRDPELRKETPGSTIYYHAFPGQKQLMGANESFRWTLSDGEAALAVAVGLGWVAVASSRNLLYVFNSAGLPCMTVALRGPVLALSGCDMALGVVYHGHGMEADLYEITFQTGCKVCKLASAVPLPLPAQQAQSSDVSTTAASLVPTKSAEQHLEWLGFDVDHHVLTVVDGQGVLWGLINCADWQWVPLLDIHQVRKSIEHTYWPTCVRNGKLVYVLLNGESRPAIYPQPVVATKSLRVPVPVLRDGKDVGDVHKERMHSIVYAGAMTAHTELALTEASAATAAGKQTAVDPAVLLERVTQLEYEADKAVLTALQDACQRQRTALALSLALQIRAEKTLMAAITIANHFGRTAVAEALDALLEQKQTLAAQLLAAQQGTDMAVSQDFAYSASEYAPEEENLFHDNAHSYDAPASPDRSRQASDRRVNFAESATANNTANALSGKVGTTAKAPVGLFGAAKAPVVSPAVSGSAEKEKVTRNPFQVVSSGATPQKRKSVYDSVQDLKASPSPNKKPALNVRYPREC